MSVPSHEPEPPQREDQHGHKRNDCHDLVAIEGHFGSLLFAFRDGLRFGRRRLRQEFVDSRADGPVAVKSSRRTDANERRLALIYSDDGIAWHEKAGTIFDLARFEIHTGLAIACGAELRGHAKVGFVLTGKQDRFRHGGLRLQRHRDHHRGRKHDSSSHPLPSLNHANNKPFLPQAKRADAVWRRLVFACNIAYQYARNGREQWSQSRKE
jgi:hypothetical protein